MKRYASVLAVLSVLLAAPLPAQSPEAAFPEAVGFGADATVSCDRSTIHVLYITTTTSGADGGFNDVMNAADSLPNSEMKYVIPTVSGRTGDNYTGDINCLYFAGHAAPGKGLTLSGDIDNRNRLLRVTGGTDLIMRGIRVEGNATNQSTSVNDINIDAFDRLYWERSTHLFATEKHIGPQVLFSGDTVRNLTFDRLALALPNAIEPTSFQFTNAEDGGEIGRGSFNRNLWHSIGWRIPALGPANDSTMPAIDRTARFVGNLHYNTGVQYNIGAAGTTDILDGQMLAGPMTREQFAYIVGVPIFSQGDSTFSFYVERLTGLYNDDTSTPSEGLWWDETDQDSDGAIDSLTAELACRHDACRGTDGGGNPRDSLGTDIQRDTAMTPPTHAPSRIDPTTLESTLIGSSDADIQVGRHRRLQADGSFTQAVDSLLSALAQEVRDSTGISSINDVDSTFVQTRNDYDLSGGTGWGTCTDSDDDDLCDSFENRWWGNTTTTDDPSGDPDGDGWTNLEEGLNGSDPTTDTPLSTAGGGGGASETYANGRKVYLTPAVVDTTILGGGSDTVVSTIPDPDSVNRLGYCFSVPDPDTSHVYAVSTADQPQGTVLDSAVAEDSASSLGTDRSFRDDPCSGQ